MPPCFPYLCSGRPGFLPGSQRNHRPHPAAPTRHGDCAQGENSSLELGVDLAFFPRCPIGSRGFGLWQNGRDHRTVCTAATRSGAPLRVICPTLPAELAWPENAVLFTGGRTDDTVSYQELLHQYTCIVQALSSFFKMTRGENRCGFTNLIEAWRWVGR